MTDCYIALGSNLENPLQQLRDAIAALAGLPASQLAAVSRAYTSAAVGPGEQPDYLNAAARLDTELAPLQLLDALQDIERRQGRTRGERWSARTLDLDLLLYGDTTLSTERLTLPHPRMSERNFVLYPLLDVADANLMLPDGRKLDTLVRACPGEALVAISDSLTTTGGGGQGANEGQSRE